MKVPLTLPSLDGLILKTAGTSLGLASGFGKENCTIRYPMSLELES